MRGKHQALARGVPCSMGESGVYGTIRRDPRISRGSGGRADLVQVFAACAGCRSLRSDGLGRCLFTPLEPILGKKIIDDRHYLGDGGVVEVPGQQRGDVLDHSAALCFMNGGFVRTDEDDVGLIVAIVVVIGHFYFCSCFAERTKSTQGGLDAALETAPDVAAPADFEDMAACVVEHTGLVMVNALGFFQCVDVEILE